MLYPGLTPSNVNRDAKYSVIHSQTDRSKWEVRLVYTVNAGVRELLTTDRHDELTAIVNEAKLQGGAPAGGAFYINEYRDVLVPTPTGCLYAGHYPYALEFDFEGGVLSPYAPEGLAPGDTWPGPHVGIRYVLTADGSDIKYELHETPTRRRIVPLSREVGGGRARELAGRLMAYKGHGGGRVYINEVCEFFSPVVRGGTTEYIYLGPLEDDPWFPAPDVPRPDD